MPGITVTMRIAFTRVAVLLRHNQRCRSATIRTAGFSTKGTQPTRLRIPYCSRAPNFSVLSRATPRIETRFLVVRSHWRRQGSHVGLSVSDG